MPTSKVLHRNHEAAATLGREFDRNGDGKLDDAEEAAAQEALRKHAVEEARQPPLEEGRGSPATRAAKRETPAPRFVGEGLLDHTESQADNRSRPVAGGRRRHDRQTLKRCVGRTAGRMARPGARRVHHRHPVVAETPWTPLI